MFSVSDNHLRRYNVFCVGAIPKRLIYFLLAERFLQRSRALLSLNVLNIAGASTNVSSAEILSDYGLKFGSLSVMQPVSHFREYDYTLSIPSSSIIIKADFHP